MYNDQIQTMISYFSSKLHTPSVTSPPELACVSTSNSVPAISSISYTFLNLCHNSYYDMLVSYVSTESNVSLIVWIIDSGATHHVTHIRDIFIEYKPLDNTFVTLPNGYTVSRVGL